MSQENIISWRLDNMSKCPFCHEEVDFLTALFWEFEHWHTECAEKFLRKKKSKLESKLKDGIESQNIKLSTARSIEKELFEIDEDLQCVINVRNGEEKQIADLAMINIYGAKALTQKNIPLKHERALLPGCSYEEVTDKMRKENKAQIPTIIEHTNVILI